jgi:hypothetical protein
MIQHAEIKPDAFYDQDAVRRLLGLSARAIGSACRSGQLRVTERGGRRFFRGSWLIAWLGGSEQHASAGPSKC